MIRPLKGVRLKAIFNNESPEDKEKKLSECVEDLLGVALIDLEKMKSYVMIKKEEPQSESKQVSEQQTNENE